MSVWEVDLTDVACSQDCRSGKPCVRKVADVPEAGLLDGMTTFSSDKGLLLVSDTKRGLVWRINVYTDAAAQILDLPNMNSIKGSVPQICLNGIHMRGRDLYYSNTDHSRVWKLPLDGTGNAIGTASVVGYGLGATLDDLALDEEGNVYVAANATESVFVPAHRSRCSTVVVGRDDANPHSGITGAAFGRTPRDRGVLYMGTTGGSFAYMSRNFTQPGGVSKMDLTWSGYWNSI